MSKDIKKPDEKPENMLAETEAAGKPERPPTAVWTGRILHRLGLLSLPLVVGAFLGFWAADRGMPWLPSMLSILLGVLIVGLIAMPFGRLLEGRAFREDAGGRKLRKRVVLCLVLACLGLAGRLGLHWTEQPSPLTDLAPRDFNRAFEADAAAYLEYERGLERTIAFLEGQEGLFPSEKSKRARVPTPDEERALLEAWGTIRNYSFGLDQVRAFYEDWYRFDPSRAERSRHLRSFLLTYAAELALYEKSSRLVRLLSRNGNVVKFLNAPHQGRRMAADSFSLYRQELQGNRDLARVLAGRNYLLWLEKALAARNQARELGCAWLWKRCEVHLEAIDRFSKLKLTSATAGSDLQVLKRAVRRVWFPAQKGIAEWMGDARVRRIGVYLITGEQLAEMSKQLEPGDVMLSRKNWYLSNVGLPGFWPHAVLYIGKPETFEAYFDDPGVRAHIEKLAGEKLTLGQYLARRFPSRWPEYLSEKQAAPREVIEATSEGVNLNTLREAGGDYLAVMRPRLGKTAKAQAMIEAFSHVGKPYDFDFDFATDHALVCTEVVWRSYRPAEGKQGLEFPLVDVVGRRTLPANEIARLFASEYGKENAQMDFVYYLAGREKERKAVLSTAEEFLKTHTMTKWSIRLE